MKDYKPYVNQYENPTFLANALAINGSVTPRVLKQVFVVVLYANLITVVHMVWPWFKLPIGPLEYAGFIMALILVFRVNAGYERWWEARKLWGDMVNKSRNIAIMILSYTESGRREQEFVLKCIAAIPYLIKNLLRSNTSVEEVEHLLGDQLSQKLADIQNRPVYVSRVVASKLAEFLQKNQLQPMPFLKIEEQREAVIDAQGACERILKTPMPFVMAVKSRRFILIFLLILPVSLVNISHIISPLVTALVAYALFSLDQIGVELQNPFSIDRLSHLPLSDICKTIEGNISELFQNS